MAFNIEKNGDIVLKTGDSDTLEFSFMDDSANPINLTGATLYFSVKNSLDALEYFIQKIITNHSDAENGLTEVSITSEETDVAGIYYYDCVLVLADGVRDSFFPESKNKTGKFLINKGVTNV